MIVCAVMTLQAERAGTDTGERLVEAARALMWEAGGPTFTVSQVVSAAGSSLKSFYRRFGSKDELLVALFADDARRGAEVLSAMVESRPTGDRLRTAVVGLFSLLQVDGRRPYAAALVAEHLRLAQRRPADLTAVLAPLVQLIQAELEGAAQRGEIRSEDPAADARTVFHLVLSHLHALVWHQIDDDPAMVSERLWAFCSAALSPAVGGGETAAVAVAVAVEVEP
jgi:AcrR family transcriptional regulator